MLKNRRRLKKFPPLLIPLLLKLPKDLLKSGPTQAGKVAVSITKDRLICRRVVYQRMTSERVPSLKIQELVPLVQEFLVLCSSILINQK